MDHDYIDFLRDMNEAEIPPRCGEMGTLDEEDMVFLTARGRYIVGADGNGGEFLFRAQDVH